MTYRNHLEVIDKDKLFDEAEFDGEYMSDEVDGLREHLKTLH